MTWRLRLVALAVLIVGALGLQTADATAMAPSHGPVAGVRAECSHRGSRSGTSGCVTTVRPKSPTMVVAGQRKLPTGASTSTTRPRSFIATTTVDAEAAVPAPAAVPPANWTRGPPSP